MKQNFKMILSICVLLLFVLTIVGNTYAYLTDKTVTKSNSFTTAPMTVLDAVLDEEWDPSTGIDMIPGASAQKEPYIKNTSSGTNACSEWIAARFTLVYADGENKGKQLNSTDLQLVMDNITIDYNGCIDTGNESWTRVIGTEKSVQQTFIYNSIVEPNERTGNLFDSISVKLSSNNASIDLLNKMGGFIIKIEGFAIQSDAYTNASEWGTTIAGNDSPAIWDIIEE